MNFSFGTWLGKKPKNRLFSRPSAPAAEAPPRASRPPQAKLAVTAFSMVAGGLISVWLTWRASQWGLEKLVFKNPAFAIATLEIHTDGILPEETLLRWSGVKRGDNLLACDLPRVERDLELQPQIAKASIERILPNSLRIRVTERPPVFRVIGFAGDNASHSLRPATYYLDAGGFILPPLENDRSRNRFDPLPALSGFAPELLLPGRQAAGGQEQSALKFIAAFSRSPLARQTALQTIDISVPGILKAVMGDGSEISFASEGFEKQLDRWRLVLNYAAAANKSLLTLDLSTPNNIPARWRAETEELLSLKPLLNPPPTRKKHV